MKPAQPIGHSSYAPFFIRVALGSWLVLSGLLELRNVTEFIAQIKSFGLMRDHVATLVAILIPYLQLGTGFLITIGLWTTLASLIAGFVFVMMLYLVGAFPNDARVFNKDVILLAASISLLYSGAGAISVDGFRAAASSGGGK